MMVEESSTGYDKNILSKLLKRQWQRVEEWESPELLSYYEEVTVTRMDKQEDVSHAAASL